MERGFSYSAQSARAGRRRLLLSTIVVVVVLGLDALSGGKLHSVARAGVGIVSSIVSRAGSNIAGMEIFSSHASLAAENQSLKRQIATLQEQAALSSALEEQVAALESVAHLATEMPGITAPVTSSFIASPYGTFLIGAGVDEGVATNDLVLSSEGTSDGILVGIVSDTSAHGATVLELFAPDHATDALLDGVAISVSGKGGGNAIAYVPNGIVVKPGDAVTAPEFGGRTIGVVGNVNADPSNAAMQVAIGSPINLDSMQYVFVVPSGS